MIMIKSNQIFRARKWFESDQKRIMAWYHPQFGHQFGEQFGHYWSPAAPEWQTVAALWLRAWLEPVYHGIKLNDQNWLDQTCITKLLKQLFLLNIFLENFSENDSLRCCTEKYLPQQRLYGRNLLLWKCSPAERSSVSIISRSRRSIYVYIFQKCAFR